MRYPCSTPLPPMSLVQLPPAPCPGLSGRRGRRCGRGGAFVQQVSACGGVGVRVQQVQIRHTDISHSCHALAIHSLKPPSLLSPHYHLHSPALVASIILILCALCAMPPLPPPLLMSSEGVIVFTGGHYSAGPDYIGEREPPSRVASMAPLLLHG